MIKIKYNNKNNFEEVTFYKDGNIVITSFAYNDATYEFEPTTFVESND